MENSLEELLAVLRDRGGSDLHVKAHRRPHIRVDGELRPLDGAARMTPEDVEQVADELLAATRERERFQETNEADLAYRSEDGGRFRANVFRQLGQVGIVIRRVLPGTPGFEALRLPPVVRRLAEQRRGLVLVTGPTGSGKTTTCAAMIEHIAATRRCHVVTIEDPIEIVFPKARALIDQREVGIDTASFASGLRHLTRQDPDVIFVGEVRDPETAAAVLHAAESGHLVLSTLHTADAVESVNRLLDFFPPEQTRQARLSLAGSLCGVISQRLVPHADGEGRVPAIEALVATTRVVHFIKEADRTDDLRMAIEQGVYEGMQTFDQHLERLVRAGDIRYEDAVLAATDPHDFRVETRHLVPDLEPADQ